MINPIIKKRDKALELIESAREASHEDAADRLSRACELLESALEMAICILEGGAHAKG